VSSDHQPIKGAEAFRQLCDWKTDSVFRRQAIVDERDLRSAVEMLAKGTIGVQSKIRAVRAVG
jgi:hypothetical protein